MEKIVSKFKNMFLDKVNSSTINVGPLNQTNNDVLFNADELKLTLESDMFVKTTTQSATEYDFQAATLKRFNNNKTQGVGFGAKIQNKLTQAFDNLRLSSLSSAELEAEKQDEIAAEQEKIDEAAAAYEQAAEELNAEMEELDAVLEEYDAQLSELDEQISDLDNQIINIDDQISQKDKEIDEKDDAITDTDNAISEKDSAISEKDAQISDVTSQISSINSEIAGINSNIASLQSQLSSIPSSTGNDEADAANAAQRASLQSQISELQAQKSEKEAQKSELEAKKSDLAAEKSQLQAEKDELKAQKEELKQQKDQLVAEKDELNAQKDELEAQKEPLQEQKAEIQKEKEAVEKDKAAVEQKIQENENSENKRIMDEGPAKIKEIEDKYNQKIEESKAKEAQEVQEIPGGQGGQGAAEITDVTWNIVAPVSPYLPQIPDYADDLYDDTMKAMNVSDKDKMHTEFGMDNDGNIVFQDANAQKAYDVFTEKTLAMLNESGMIDELGGEENARKLIQSGWMLTYDTIERLDGKGSADKHNTKDFMFDASMNVSRLIEEAKSNPEALETVTKRSSYADSSLTDGLPYYNTNTTYRRDEKIDYSGKIIKGEDGSIHISNAEDDRDYQKTMDALLERLYDKYPELDKETITMLFRDSQRTAISAMQENKNDCPYGTGNNTQRVEDGNSKDWSGKDSRKGDKSVANMDQIVQMTLYQFDKALYNHTVS